MKFSKQTLFWGLALVFATAHGVSQAQGIGKVKDGDKIVIDYSTYDARGREVVVAKTDRMDSTVSVQGNNYLWVSPLGSSLTVRETHTTIERAAGADPRQPIPEQQRMTWFPAGGDFSKLQGGTVAISNQRCGLGTYKYDATATPSKRTVTLAGVPTELAVQEVSLKGRWIWGSCGSGEQTMRFVYAPQLDFLVERDLKSFGSNGILNQGNQMKVVAIQ